MRRRQSVLGNGKSRCEDSKDRGKKAGQVPHPGGFHLLNLIKLKVLL